MDQQLIWNYYHYCVRTERKRMLTFQNYWMLAVVDYMLFMQLSVQDARLQIGKQKDSSEHFGICSMIHQQEEMTTQQWLGQQSFLWNSVWVEDDRVAERALEIWPNDEKYMKHVLKEPKSKQPTSASYSTIQKATKDVLVSASYKFLCTFPKS